MRLETPSAAALLFAGVAALVACDNSEECAALQELHYDHQRALAIGRARAGLAQKTKANAAQAEKRTQEVLTKYGLDRSEDQITKTLKERVASIAGANVERTVRSIPGEDPTQKGRKETVWSIQLPTRSFAEASQHARDLAALPPLMRLSSLIARKEGWAVELTRVVVDRLPIKFKPQPLPIPRDPADIPSKAGFCGAEALRDKITLARAELDALKDEAAEATVYLPMAASWEGLRLRARHATELESEARRILDVFFTAARRAKLRVKAIGQQQDTVILEFLGGPQDRRRLDRLLPEDVLASVQYDDQDPGLFRLLMANRMAEGGHHGEHKEEEVNSMGLPTPDALKQQFEKARQEMLKQQGSK